MTVSNALNMSSRRSFHHLLYIFCLFYGQEFATDRDSFLPPWVLYFSGCEERDRLLEVLDSAWRSIFQVGVEELLFVFSIFYTCRSMY